MNLTTLKELLKLLNTYIHTGRQTDSDIKRTIKSIKYIQTDRQVDRQTDRQMIFSMSQNGLQPN